MLNCEPIKQSILNLFRRRIISQYLVHQSFSLNVIGGAFQDVIHGTVCPNGTEVSINVFACSSC